MIKMALSSDAFRVIDYLESEGSLNATLLAHIEKYGFEKDFQNVWIQMDDENGETLAVILRHFNNLYIYCRGSLLDNGELVSFTSFTGADIISGKRDTLSGIALSLGGMMLETSHHMILKVRDQLVPCTQVKKAGLEDCAELSALNYGIPEFARFYHSRAEIERGIQRRMEMGICRYYVLKRDGLIVSQAYTTIESQKYATIGGVVTREEYRKQGLASLVVSCISHDILTDGKIPGLFFSNEEAGHVYERLGFVHAGDYAMLLDHKYSVDKKI